MEKEFDAILYMQPQQETINEDDPRYSGTGKPISGIYHGSQYYNADDPRLYASNAFGKVMQSDLNNMGRGYSANVTDFGKWVVVDISYHNFVTGRTASKTFLVVFTDKNDGLVMSTSNKWRTISGYPQAVSYIKSAASSLENSTSTKL